MLFIISSIILFFFLVPGCANVALVGNSFCNDETNIADCNYDGGDCCGYCVNTEHCEDCACLGNITSDQITNAFIGNSLCNDETNNLNCNYDGGDCCGYNINSEHCTECTCFHKETCLAGVFLHAFVGDGVCNDETNIAECDYDGGDCCPNPNIVGDAICHDETNHLGCNYDGGDCCVNVNRDSCSDCNCLASGVITSPGLSWKL